MKVFNFNIGAACGGALTETSDTVALWKSMGIDVTCLHPKQCNCGQNTPPMNDNPFLAKAARLGIPIVEYESGKLHEVPGLVGSIVTNFCSSHFIHNLPEIKAIGCKTAHSSCMTTIPVRENIFANFPPDAAHFQSQYQQSQLGPQYADWGIKNQTIIRGAFDTSGFPFNPKPHKPGEPFYVGRLARGVRSKWSPHIFSILKAVRAYGVDVRFLGMAWNDDLAQWLGEPPEWAECIPENSISSREFLARCHCLICPNASDRENYPRVGLEAMSAGVPIIADNLGGWPEMISNGVDGLLCNATGDYFRMIKSLAEVGFGELARMARNRVERLSHAPDIGSRWMGLFGSLME